MYQTLYKFIIEQIRNLTRACLKHLFLKTIEHNKQQITAPEPRSLRTHNIFFAYQMYKLVTAKKTQVTNVAPTPDTPPALRSFKRNTAERKNITNKISFGGVEEYILKAKPTL